VSAEILRWAALRLTSTVVYRSACSNVVGRATIARVEQLLWSLVVIPGASVSLATTRNRLGSHPHTLAHENAQVGDSLAKNKPVVSSLCESARTQGQTRQRFPRAHRYRPRCSLITCGPDLFITHFLGFFAGLLPSWCPERKLIPWSSLFRVHMKRTSGRLTSNSMRMTTV